MKTIITPILGRIFCPDKEMDDDFKGQSNSTRWVFDVEHEFDKFETVTKENADKLSQKSVLELVHIQLAEYRTGRIIKPDVFSFSIGPMTDSCYKASPHIQIRNGLFHLIVKISNGGGCKYRVAIDTIHSANR